MARLWQALTVPLRATAQYRARVAMLLPEPGPLTSPPHPTMWTIVSQPANSIPTPRTRPLRHEPARDDTAPVTGVREFDQFPASAAPAPGAAAGQSFMLRGHYLADADPCTWSNTAGRGGNRNRHHRDLEAASGAALHDGARRRRALHAAPAAHAARRLPATRQYGLRVGQPGKPAWRSATVPFSIAPWIDPAGGPLLNPSGGTYSFNSANIPPADAELRLGTVGATQVASGVPGGRAVDVSGSTVRPAPAWLPAAT